MRRALVSAIFGIILFPLVSFAHLDFKKPEGFFSDSASLLSPKSGSAIESLLSSYTKETANEIAVLIIPSLEGDPIEDVAVEVFQSWGIGQKGKDNGVLLLISKEDKEVRIEVGYGLEPDLTDAEVGAIIRNTLTPAFKEGKYDEGVGLALEAIIKGIGGTIFWGKGGGGRRGGRCFFYFFWEKNIFNLLILFYPPPPLPPPPPLDPPPNPLKPPPPKPPLPPNPPPPIHQGGTPPLFLLLA